MSRQLLICLVFYLIVSLGAAKGKEKNLKFYPASTILPSLKENAYAIFRCYEHEFELIDYGRATEKVHVVITILSHNGDKYSELYLPYDNSRIIKSITGQTYNEAGFPVKKIKNSDVDDVNYNSAGTLFDEIRIKRCKLTSDSYPYTIEYVYEIEHKGLISYPEWTPVDDYRFSVEHSSFRMIWPENLKIRYREFNIPGGIRKEKIEAGKYIYEWALESLSAVREEIMAPKLYTQMPRLIIGPINFTYSGSSGEMTTWEKHGAWYYELNRGLDHLSDARKSTIKSLVGEITDTISAVKAIYKYMQQRTRYVGIQLGLGGFQPFSAETVDRLGYGDCKALSNYMRALLNAVSIPSVYTVVGAGSNEGIVMDDFPTNNQTNHVVLCVPMQNDSIWLECTDQTNPCGYMGTFTGGRKALTINPDGGKLARIPKLSILQNFQDRTATIQISSEGTMQGKVKTVYSGYEYEAISGQLLESPDDQKKSIMERLSIAGFTLHAFNYTEKPDIVPEVEETLDFSSSLSVSKTTSRLFVPLNLFSQRVAVPKKVDERRFPFVQRYASIEKDSAVFYLPERYKIETIPQEKSIKTEFGEYYFQLFPQDDKIIFQRELKIYEGTWEKEKYPLLIDFYTMIANGDKNRLVLKQELSNN